MYLICALVVMGFWQVTAIYSLLRLWDGKKWIPAFAGMTVWRKN